MALPVILVNSATGSDTAASGAGPSTALTGTAGATDVAGTTVTLDAGTDLSGVATDGSHAIYMNNTTAGQRRFAKITATAGSGGATPTVTVAEAYTGSLSGKTWAIGGVRASIGSTSTEVLFDNNGAAGDAMGGWIVEMQSGHTETIGSTYDMRRSGSNTLGPIVLRGTPGAATRPIVTFSNNGSGFASRGVGQQLRSFEIRNSNATKTASIGVHGATGAGMTLYDVVIAHSTNKFWKGVQGANGQFSLTDCEIGYTASTGYEVTDGCSLLLRGSYIHDCGGAGITTTTAGNGVTCAMFGNVVVNNTGDGLNYAAGMFSSVTLGFNVCNNTFAGNGGDGMEITFAFANGPWTGMNISNNIFASNTGYGLNFSNAGITAAGLKFYGVLLQSNAFYSNTSGPTNPANLDTAGVSLGHVTLSAVPFVDTTARNYALNTAPGGGSACRGTAFPGVFPGGTMTGYLDIGAVQGRGAPRTTYVLGI